MKIKHLLFLLLVSSFAMAQGEANIWYFGQNAGLDFNSGSPVAVTNGQLITDEGCATISNADGQLLFYTDGITVYNRNHAIMINGAGLMGHPSSTQSSTIVPKPGSSNLYYIFTTDQEHDPNGFRYSVVDMNLDSGNGTVTADKNILIYSPTTEGFGITKHGNGQDFWIITHGWDNNSFIAYQLTSSGLNLTPVITNIGLPITGSGFIAAGIIKIAPSGTKLAITSVSDFAQLYDFNNITGILSNEQTLIIETGELYGVAFSPDELLLYLSNSFGKIYQFNLNSTDIPNSKITLYNGFPVPGQMQIAPDNKIYVAFNDSSKLGVINNPNALGANCNFQQNGIDLVGKYSKLGLPSFNQSFFFSPSILLTSNCEDENSDFTFSTNLTVLSATWDFGDGNTSNSINPTHSYTNPGIYTVSISVTTPFGAGSNSSQITIFPKPSLLVNAVALKQCDDDNDGFSAFNLTGANELVVASTTGLLFSYFETFAEAQNNSNPIPNFTTYTNQIVSSDQVFIRVENANGCFSIITLNLIVSTTLIPSTFQKVFTVCDDTTSGSHTDGIATFDFSSVTALIEDLYPTGQLLDITYYKNLLDALSESNWITNISNYTNIGYPTTQNIYVRVDSQLNNECLGLGHHITLNVEAIPIIQSLSYRKCDDNQDGIFDFDTSNTASTILNGLTGVNLSYWDENNNPLSSPLPNPFNTNSQIVKVRATNNTSNGCYFESTITFTVDDLPEAFSIPTNLTTVCDDEVNPIDQDGLYSFNTSSFQNTILGEQTGMIVNYFDGSGNALVSPLPNPFVSGTQNISIEVINPTNSNCFATATIPLIVKQVPKIDLDDDELVCSNNPLFTKIINAGLLDETTISNYFYQWFLDGILLTGEINYSLTVNTDGIYTVEVSNVNGCSRTRTITVTASNIATIDNIEVIDLSNENSVTVLVTGSGEYVYSLDNMNFQSANTFTNVKPGIYTVYVRDLNGCGTAFEDISVLGIPNYFTPNNDGYHDYWNIRGANSQFNSETVIYIFDRYGKLLMQISPLSEGWDGNFNGKLLPADDYWYSIQLQDGRSVKGHFSLKR